MPITHPYRDIPMKMKQEMKRYARKVKGKLTTVFDPDHLEALARQTGFIQRSSSKLSGKDVVELMTTEMIEDPAGSAPTTQPLRGDLFAGGVPMGSASAT